MKPTEPQQPQIQPSPTTPTPIENEPLHVPPPMQENAYLEGSGPGITIGILALVFGIIVPPVGIVLGIIAMFTGFSRHNGNRKLGIMGVVSIPVAIVAFFVIVYLLIGDVVYSDYGTYQGEHEGIHYSFDYPEIAELETSLKYTNTANFTHKDEHGLLYSAGVFTLEVLPGYASDDFEKVYKTKEGKDLLIALINQGMFGQDVGVTINKVDFDYQSDLGEAFTADYSAQLGTANITGRVYFAYDSVKGLGYSYILAAQSDVWELNQDEWDSLFNSVTIN